jgi:hypothetical protein
MTHVRWPLACAALLLATGLARAGDPHPPQLNVTFLAQPAPLIQDGTTRLYYEMVVTNFASSDYTLDAVEATAGATTAKFDSQALAKMIRPLGVAKTEQAPEQAPEQATDRVIAGGRSVIVFLELDLGKSNAPDAIAHSLRVLDDHQAAHDIAIAPIPVSSDAPIVVAPPLRGEWIAGDSASNLPDAAHRRAVLVSDGHAWIAQRYAIDWVQYQTVDGKRTTWRGPEDRNESYFCYDQPIYSVAAGKVVDASDGMPENVPHSQKYVVALDFNNAAGNHAVIEVAPHRYVLYAHMRPGTVGVKVGDRVGLGQIIGHVGNTGSSAEPHLHMHIDDQPSFLGGNGVPYAFTSGEESGPVEANVSSPTAVYFGPIGPQRPFANDYPAENALVTFK